VRVLAVTAGSWGDILPFVPPVQALLRRGHEVVLAAPPIFRSTLRRAGCSPVAVGSFLKRETRLAFEASVGVDDIGRSPFVHYWTEVLLGDTERTFYDLLPHAEGVDVLLAHHHSVAALLVAERSGVPRVALSWGPACIPSQAYPPPSAAIRDPQQALPPSTSVRNEWERELDWARARLDPHTNDTILRLGGTPVDAAPFSLPLSSDGALLASHPAVMPDAPDWPAVVAQVGYPYSDDIHGVSARSLDPFFAEGEPPVLVSFGTAVAGGADGTYERVVDVLLRRGRRVVVLGGSGRRISGDARVAHADFAPISQLVGRCAFIVHHGGPGTMHAALRAGIPAVVVPQFLDQPCNAAFLHSRGGGIALAPHALSADALHEAIDALESPGLLARVAALQAAITADRDPAEVIADHVERAAMTSARARASQA
jgi:UDP:flavonoid glycosyltransferase YjiC (YdhE family)